MKTVGDRIKGRRLELKLQQNDVAAQAGIRAPSLRDIESGRTKRPAGDTLVKLASILKTTPESLQGAKAGARGDIVRSIEKVQDKDLPKVRALLANLVRRASPKK